jgi:hypothetical protein
MLSSRIDTRPRIQKSDKAELKLRCKPFRGWLNGRKCRIQGLKGHVCRGPVRACHVDYAGGKGTSIKVSDRFCIPMCDRAHEEQGEQEGWGPFEEKYGINALQDSREYWRLWPSRVKWCAEHPEFET